MAAVAVVHMNELTGWTEGPVVWESVVESGADSTDNNGDSTSNNATSTPGKEAAGASTSTKGTDGTDKPTGPAAKGKEGSVNGSEGEGSGAENGVRGSGSESGAERESESEDSEVVRLKEELAGVTDPLQRIALEEEIQRRKDLAEVGPEAAVDTSFGPSSAADGRGGIGSLEYDFTQPLEPEAPPVDRATLPPVFPIDTSINSKLFLWEGKIESLDVDAIVIPSNERMDQQTGVPGIIHALAGPELLAEVQTLEPVRTGDCRVAGAYNLPAKKIFFTVAPRYNNTYRIAAENALHNCYRSSMQALKEGGLRTIAFSVLHSERRGYPADEGAHIAARTVRRFLEHYGADFDAVVLCCGTPELTAVYAATLWMYFPRTADEEQAAKTALPEDTGNELGETDVEERKIRIGGLGHRAEIDDELELDAAKLAEMTNDHDLQRMIDVATANGEDESEIEYYRMLKRARTQDLSDLAAMNFIYRGGVDRLGRNVVVFIGRHLPVSAVDLDRVLMYMCTVMEPFVHQHYVVVYVHTDSDSTNQPDLSWLNKLFSTVARKYRHNLKSSYVLHPTLWLRMVTWFLQSFVSAKFLENLTYIYDLPTLWESIDDNELPLPEFVLERDYAKNPAAYVRRRQQLQEQQQRQQQQDSGAGGSGDGPFAL